MSYKNYKPTGNSFTHEPKNNHLVIETSTAIYYVSNDDATELWKYTISSGDDAQLDVDPSDTSADNKSRDHPIISAWHNRDTNKIWFVDCENAGDDYDVWYLDTSDDSVTEVGSTPTEFDAGTVSAFDIFYGDSKHFVFCEGTRTEGEPPHQDNWEIHQVDSAPFTILYRKSHGINNRESFGVVRSDKYYQFHNALPINWTHSVYRYDCANNLWPLIDTVTGYAVPSNESLRTTAYIEDQDIVFEVVDKEDKSDHYLLYYDFDNSEFLEKGIYEICLQADRNTASGVLEKGFHITDPKVYQIDSKKAWLYHIATLTTTKTIKAITDNYVILE